MPREPASLCHHLSSGIRIREAAEDGQQPGAPLEQSRLTDVFVTAAAAYRTDEGRQLGVFPVGEVLPCDQGDAAASSVEVEQMPVADPDLDRTVLHRYAMAEFVVQRA